MTPASRALLGAAVGALITLCLHPDSRPYMAGAFSRVRPASINEAVEANRPVVPEPKSAVDASLWMQLAAERLQRRSRLAPAERRSLLQIAEEAQKLERTNAFWPQMRALLYDDSGRIDLAVSAWNEAAKCSLWRDYQIERLLKSRQQIEQIVGNHQSWQLAYLYFERSDDIALCLDRLVRHLLQSAHDDTPAGIQIRYSTLVNGDLIQQNARSSKTNIIARNIVELTAFPSELVGTISPKHLYTGENRLLDSFDRVLKNPEYRVQASKIFKRTESWHALTQRDSGDSEVQIYSTGSVISASVAGAHLAILMVGLVFLGLARILTWRLGPEKEIKWYFAVGTAILLGYLVYVLTHYVPASAVVAMCAVFLTVAPDKTRRVNPTHLGPLLGFMAGFLGLICSIMLATCLITSTPEAILVLTRLGVPNEYLNRPLFAGLAAVTFGLVLLISPFWALVHRVGTPHVLGLILRKFGVFISVYGLSLSVILGPVSVFVDRQIEQNLFQLVTNEPLHYYLQQ